MAPFSGTRILSTLLACARCDCARDVGLMVACLVGAEFLTGDPHEEFAYATCACTPCLNPSPISRWRCIWHSHCLARVPRCD